MLLLVICLVNTMYFCSFNLVKIQSKLCYSLYLWIFPYRSWSFCCSKPVQWLEIQVIRCITTYVVKVFGLPLTTHWLWLANENNKIDPLKLVQLTHPLALWRFSLLFSEEPVWLSERSTVCYTLIKGSFDLF